MRWHECGVPGPDVAQAGLDHGATGGVQNVLDTRDDQRRVGRDLLGEGMGGGERGGRVR